ncbi:cobalt-precorrin-6A reductase [Candidatus Mycolicibacterium alkanivorans]|uniref:Cobalt-precorrin-6A reductase n=1 Tax=Candidatus Mycolicibacterium alkanivorans TaxID=2954114 RepID=A0ABS9YW92_9MYCO|nr:cobalt-precorrin-6A reductase [Candidatus Mycolicibacterium alkanivorans]MCI4675494.1 cobalt-precorrin-6A reductase [Candidatus Mycolicibacterium alkanivorans]
MRILLLGGTGEARALAARLHPDTDIISSLAGRVPDPALPVGPVRIGGFGGAEGLTQWLRDNDIRAVVDATHPFAATMTARAAQACADLKLPHVVLARPAWNPGEATLVASDTEAADIVAQQGYSRVFLTTGRSGVAPFTGSDAWFLIRVVTPPDPEVLPRHHEVLLSRGPYGYGDEYALLRDNRIEVLVTKNSGGALTEAKLAAAKNLGVAVVMIDRPPLPAGVETVSTVDEAVAWVLRSCPPGPQVG